MSFAILRTKKHSSIKSVAGSASHQLRERDTPNADPKRHYLNQDTLKTSQAVAGAIEGRLKAFTGRKQHNSVIAIEYLIGASPDAEIFKSKSKTEAYFKSARHWLEERHGKENIISLHLQLDEKTPHLCAYVMPFTKDGRLSCRDFLGGKAKMSEMQDSFAARVQKYGLTRGVKGSQATHEKVKRHYGLMNQITPVEPLTRLEMMGRGGKVLAEDIEALRVQVLEHKESERRLIKERDRAVEKMKRAEQTKQEIDLSNLEVRDSLMRLLKGSWSKLEFAHSLGVEIRGKEDVFDALKRQGMAKDLNDAINLVVAKMPRKLEKGGWSEAVAFDLELGKAPALKPTPKAGASARPAPPVNPPLEEETPPQGRARYRPR